MEHTLTIKGTGKYGTRGQRYEVFHGAELIASGVSPEFSACRALKERGFSGFVRFARPGTPYHLRMGIEWGATHCTTEGQRIGIHFARWEPISFGENEREEDMAA